MPGQYETVRVLLGHRSLDTTLRHYAGLEGAAAARHYDETLRAAARQADLSRLDPRSAWADARRVPKGRRHDARPRP